MSNTPMTKTVALHWCMIIACSILFLVLISKIVMMVLTAFVKRKEDNMKKFLAVILAAIMVFGMVGLAVAETEETLIVDLETSAELGEILDGRNPLWVMWIIYHQGLEDGIIDFYYVGMDDEYNPYNKTIYYSADSESLYLDNGFGRFYAIDTLELSGVWSLSMMAVLREINDTYNLGLTFVRLED